MLHDYILEFFNWQKMNHKTKQMPLILYSSANLHSQVPRFSKASTATLSDSHRCIPIIPPTLGCLLPNTHEAATSVFVFFCLCFLHLLKMQLFAPHLLMGAYSSIKVSAHQEAWTFWGDKEVRKANNSKVIKSPHRDIKFNLAGHGRQRTSEGHRQVNGRHRFA